MLNYTRKPKKILMSYFPVPDRLLIKKYDGKKKINWTGLQLVNILLQLLMALEIEMAVNAMSVK